LGAKGERGTLILVDRSYFTRAPVGQKKLSCFTHKAERNVEAARTGMWDGV